MLQPNNMTPHEQEELFQRWLNEHGAMLHHVARGFAQGADQQDLTQELMLALWRAAPSFRGGSKESTFIYRVAHNAALVWQRSRKAYRSKLERLEAQPDDPPERDRAAANREALDHVYAAIRSLDPLDRSLILLQLDQLSYAEIAAIHGLSETAVGARLTRIKQKIANQLKDIIHELR